jgi:mono/diheme cytochrome c family protein
MRVSLWTAASLVAGSLALPLSAPAADAPAPTFTKDVAPILQRSCQVCHRPEGIAPMSLLTYEEARPWARSIKTNVAAGEMPPWYIDRHVGIKKFKNDTSLSDQEITTIVAWVDGGAPRGNPADMPPPRKFLEVGKFSITPDQVVTLDKDVPVAARAADQWKLLEVDPKLTEDRYLKAIEVKPSKGYKTVHHTIVRMQPPDRDDDLMLSEYGLGKGADVFPDGSGILLKAGTKFIFDMHLHSNGESQNANVEVGLVYYPKGYTPPYVQIISSTGNAGELDIPPNSDNVRHDGYTTLLKPTRLLSFQPHMHNRGKAMCVEAIYPAKSATEGTKTETLSCVSKYRFSWHRVYEYADDVQPLLPAGTILHVMAWTDNSHGNKSAPDPENLITGGQRTVDEMSFAWMKWYYLSDDEFKAAVDARKASTARSTQDQQQQQ